MKKTQYLFIFAVLVMLLGLAAANAQTLEEPQILKRYSCEDGNERTDSLRQAAKEKGERIFIVSRAGDGETETINTHRIDAVKAQLAEKNRWSGIEPEVVYARGERVKGKGQVEFYIGSRLALVFIIQIKGKAPCLYCCEDPFEKKSVRKVKNGY